MAPKTRKSALKANPLHQPLRAQIGKAAAHGHPFYVYTLSDAVGVFYIGKGKRNRVFAHECMQPADTNGAKLTRIAQAGPALQRSILAFFPDSASALAHESMLIQEGQGQLTNIAPGASDPRQRAIEHAESMLARVRPFSETPMANWFNQAEARTLYDNIVAEIQELTINPFPREITFAPGRPPVYSW